MKINDILKIKNSAGMMEIKLTKCITLDYANKYGLGEFGNCRVELHKHNIYGGVITLYNKSENVNTDIFVICPDGFDEPEIFLGEIICNEEKNCFYETMC